MAPSPPDEIRARATLPGMSEMLSLPGPGEAGLDPMSLWLDITRQAWAPWFALWGLSAGSSKKER